MIRRCLKASIWWVFVWTAQGCGRIPEVYGGEPGPQGRYREHDRQRGLFSVSLISYLGEALSISKGCRDDSASLHPISYLFR